MFDLQVLYHPTSEILWTFKPIFSEYDMLLLKVMVIIESVFCSVNFN